MRVDTLLLFRRIEAARRKCWFRSFAAREAPGQCLLFERVQMVARPHRSGTRKQGVSLPCQTSLPSHPPTDIALQTLSPRRVLASALIHDILPPFGVLIIAGLALRQLHCGHTICLWSNHPTSEQLEVIWACSANLAVGPRHHPSHLPDPLAGQERPCLPRRHHNIDPIC